jgi:hypothetical protein
MEMEEEQRIFLDALVVHGTLLAARRETGVSRRKYQRWMVDDPGFSQRIDESRRDFGEGLEGLALERVRNPDRSHGSDVLLIGLLNANLPHKYRPAQAMDVDSAKELIVEWRKAAKQAKATVQGEEKGSEENSEELSAPLERTLMEILAKRGAKETEKGSVEGEGTS